jgi:ubiquinone biosynthesis protein
VFPDVVRPMPRRRIIRDSAGVQVQLPRARRVVFKPGIVLPALRLLVWLQAAFGFFSGNLLDLVMGRASIQRRAARLRRVFENIGGSFAKLGQQLSLRADILPYAYCAELAHMLDKVPPFPTAQAIATIERNARRPLHEIFATFDPDPIGSASLACVYQAALRTGGRVAVKVRRPDIGRLIAADLRALEWLIKAAETLTLVRPGLSGDFLTDLRAILFDELNFRTEARYTDLFRRRSQKNAEVTAPRIFFQYCSEEVIVSELVSGIWMWELMAAVDNDDEEFLLKARAMGIEPKSLARKLLRTMHSEALDQPFHHADPHPANLVVLPNNVICYIDFGAIGRFSTQTRKAWREMWYHMMSGDISRLATAGLHFLGPLPPVDIERLTSAVSHIFADFLYATTSKDAAWWERSSAQIWLRFVEVANELGLSVSLETLQLFRATLLYDSIIIRLDKDFDFGREYGPYIRKAARAARHRTRKTGRFGLTQASYLALEQVADSGIQFFSRLQRTIEEPVVGFRNVIGKIAYTATLLLRLCYVAVAVMGVAVLADGTSQVWFGHGIHWAAMIEPGAFSSRWVQIAIIVLALVLIRRVVVRLSLPDKRMDPDR